MLAMFYCWRDWLVTKDTGVRLIHERQMAEKGTCKGTIKLSVFSDGQNHFSIATEYNSSEQMTRNNSILQTTIYNANWIEDHKISRKNKFQSPTLLTTHCSLQWRNPLCVGYRGSQTSRVHWHSVNNASCYSQEHK